ncbi:hypothetical protein [Massilia sp. 9096]|uniref:hypothetical protein n=1 Tax=Massilia sp. 9096 TaxID=1500894 RepID=UPI00056AC1B4|nr:hypothetical protein [Massilia sp. 9096]
MTPSRASLAAIVVAAVVGAWLALGPRQAASPDATAQHADSAGQPGHGGWLDPGMLRAGADPAERSDFVTAPAVPIYGRNGRAIDFGGKDAAAYIDERAAAARTGDLHAAYQVYQAASACAAAEDPLPEFLDPQEGETAVRERAHVRALCARVSPAQLQERMRFLTRAADAGERAAQVDFFMEGPNGKPLAEADTSDPQVQQWQQQALAYLKGAGAQCDQFALGLLSNAYDAGQLGARDPALAMAYQIASNAARNKPLTEQQLRQRWGEELAPADFDSARAEGAQITGASCPAQGQAQAQAQPQS